MSQDKTTTVLAELWISDGVMGSPSIRHKLDMAIGEIERLRAALIKIGSYQGKSLLEMGDMAREAINHGR